MTQPYAPATTAPIPFVRPRARPEHPTETPAGLQDKRDLAARRAVILTLNLATLAAVLYGLWSTFAFGGLSIGEAIFVACAAFCAPWTILGVWNAFAGFWLLHLSRDGLRAAAPHLGAGEADAPITARIALTMTLRNEDPERSFHRLAEMRRSLDATGYGDRFAFFLLSDTSDPEIAAAEARLFAKMQPALGGARAHYRRRPRNEGFKAGNLREFLANHGRQFDLFLPLDSDSLMSGAAILRMARIMQAYPRIGILQSLVVGAPATSAFARIFQFGMRHGMRSFTLGSAWWQGDCGPYWGHNALIRVDAFRRHCRLPVLPGRPPLGGHILSHDQIEAVLMRRAGYEVRVIPVEGESWEDNPPTLQDFTKRDLRWCQGNMQYWQLLGLRGLRPVSRLQVVIAIMMYLSAPAWMLMVATAAGMALVPGMASVDAAFGTAMFFIMLTVSLVPKLVGLLDTAVTRGGAAAYGGRLRFALSALSEIVFSVLIAPVVAFRVTLFLIGLLFGQRITWSGQNRDAYRLRWADAARGLWPQTLFGATLTAVIWIGAGPATLVWAAPMLAGLLLSIPFAVLTAEPRIGRWAVQVGLCAIPDEIAGREALDRVAEAMRLGQDGGTRAA